METKSRNFTQAPQLATVESPEKASSSPFKEFYSLLNQGKLEEAILLLEKAAPCWEKANLLGCYHAEIMNFSKAEKEFLEALCHDPDNIDTLCNLAKLYNDFFQPYEAKKYMEMYLQKEPNDPIGLFYYAVVLLDLDLEDDAYEILKRVLVINPTDVYVITNLALIILNKNKRPKVALRLLKKAASINPADSEVLFRLAGVAWELGEELTFFNAREMLQLIDPGLCAELDERTGRAI
jgi:tetratricopeptide (TPR) repeat protein